MGQAGDPNPSEWQPYDDSECRGVYVPAGMTRDMVVGTAKIISDFLENNADTKLNRYFADTLARDVVTYLQKKS